MQTIAFIYFSDMVNKPLFYYFILICLCPAPQLRAQETMKNYVDQHTVLLRTIDPDSAVDAGLEAIGKSIGDARVVLLGEQDHGDGPAYLAKTRLIKYLHEKKGFNVLAFESDFFALTQGWERLPKEERAIDTFIRYNIFPIWTYCSTCQDLFFRYLPATFRTATPLELTGFDNQMPMRYSRAHLVPWMDSVMRNLGLPIVQDPSYTTRVLPLLDSAWKWYTKDTAWKVQAARLLDTISAQAGARLDPRDFRMMVIRNLVEQVAELRVMEARTVSLRTQGFGQTRDRQMGRNLAWLSDVRYPNEKIIVWAASAHTARMAGNFPEWSTTAPSMGDQFMGDSLHRKKTYSIGFSSLEGTAGRLTAKQYVVRTTRRDAFEKWMPVTAAYAFLDFQPYNAAHPDAAESFYMSGISHLDVKAIWNRVFDGVLYIRTTYPCTAVQ